MREAFEYRGARRNAWRNSVDRPRPAWRNSFNLSQRKAICLDGSFRGRIALNRSEKWPAAKSYVHAREIGPSAEPAQ